MVWTFGGPSDDLKVRSFSWDFIMACSRRHVRGGARNGKTAGGVCLLIPRG